jgi:methyltransferase (TIGR00027 family)
MSSDLPANDMLAFTSRWTAAARARESQRSDRLFNDPWAAALAGDAGKAAFERSAGSQDSILDTYLAIRTRFFDDFLMWVTYRQGVRQVVLIAAGMDTRAYRLLFPPYTHVFELDRPAVLNRKAEIMSAIGAKALFFHRLVGVDLNIPWDGDLLEAGFNPRQRAVWLMEGCLYYLAEGAVLDLFDLVTDLSTSLSWLAFDVANPATLASPWMKDGIRELEKLGIAWRFTTDAPEAIVEERGWAARVMQPGEEGANYGRWAYPTTPRTDANIPRSYLVTAKAQG